MKITSFWRTIFMKNIFKAMGIEIVKHIMYNNNTLYQHLEETK